MENKAGSQPPEEAGRFHDDNDDDVPIASRASLRETGRGGPPNKDQGQENHSKQLHDKDNYSTEQQQMNKKKVVITGSLHDLVDKDHLREQTLNNTEMSPNTVLSCAKVSYSYCNHALLSLSQIRITKFISHANEICNAFIRVRYFCNA